MLPAECQEFITPYLHGLKGCISRRARSKRRSYFASAAIVCVADALYATGSLWHCLQRV